MVGREGLASNSVYSATKAALRLFARTWTTDLKDRRIRVNAVSPGSIETPGLSGLLASSPAGEERKKMISNLTPLGRLGRPDEIASAVVFLASDDSSYVTGVELFVDGGFAQVYYRSGTFVLVVLIYTRTNHVAVPRIIQSRQWTGFSPVSSDAWLSTHSLAQPNARQNRTSGTECPFSELLQIMRIDVDLDHLHPPCPATVTTNCHCRSTLPACLANDCQ